MTPFEMFLISFFGSFLGTLCAFALNLLLYQKQKIHFEKMKKSIQRSIRRLKKEKKK